MVVIILAHNQFDYNVALADSIIKSKDSKEGVKIVWVNNASDDGKTPQYLKALCKDNGWVYRNNIENVMFTEAVQRVIDSYEGEDIYLLNNDVVVYDGWLLGRDMLKDYGMIGACQVYPSEPDFITFAGGGVDYASHNSMWRWEKWKGIKESLWLTFGACMINRKAYDNVGGLDERLLFYCSDSDLSLRMRETGYKIGVLAEMTIGHWGGMTTKSVVNDMSRQGREDQVLFAQKHGLVAFGFDFRAYKYDERKEWFKEYFKLQRKGDRAEIIGNRIGNYLYKKLNLKGKRVLELGSGMGFVVKNLREKGVDCTGLDLVGSEFVTACDFETELDTLDTLGKFDVIISSAVLEHIPSNTIRNLLDKTGVMLNTAGLFYHEIDTQIGVDRTRINCMTPIAIDSLFYECGFKIEEKELWKSGMYCIKGVKK